MNINQIAERMNSLKERIDHFKGQCKGSKRFHYPESLRVDMARVYRESGMRQDSFAEEIGVNTKALQRFVRQEKRTPVVKTPTVCFDDVEDGIDLLMGIMVDLKAKIKEQKNV